jgi:hypothetical protein
MVEAAAQLSHVDEEATAETNVFGEDAPIGAHDGIRGCTPDSARAAVSNTSQFQ